jgi:hypothetical protein
MNENGTRERALFFDFGSILDERYAVDELRGEMKISLQLIRDSVSG